MSADAVPDAVVNVHVLPKFTGALVINVKSLESVRVVEQLLVLRLIAVELDGLRCHTAYVPCRLVWVASHVLKFVTASVASFDPQFVMGVVVG